MFPEMHKIIKPGEVGIAKVRHFTPTKLDIMQAMFGGWPLYEGTYVVLNVNGRVMMSDTQCERFTNREAVIQARGNVLVAGLGIGMVLQGMIEKDSVAKVTVLEKEADVIKLIGPTVKSPKVEIIHADAFEWRPPVGSKFDAIYFDIWADASMGKATSDKRRLAGRYRKYKAKDGWMGSWKPYTVR